MRCKVFLFAAECVAGQRVPSRSGNGCSQGGRCKHGSKQALYGLIQSNWAPATARGRIRLPHTFMVRGQIALQVMAGGPRAAGVRTSTRRAWRGMFTI